MLTERKRYNYNITPTLNSRNNSSQKKLAVSSCINTQLPLLKSENPPITNKRVEELEALNKKIIEETTRNFKRLESDVQRVERILEEKENHITELQQQSKSLAQSLQNANQEKQLLIEAIFSKDLVIKEFEAKLKELIDEKNREPTTSAVNAETAETDVQTDPQPDTYPADQINSLLEQNRQLQEQLASSKGQLLAALSKSSSLRQQMQAYQLLGQKEEMTLF